MTSYPFRQGIDYGARKGTLGLAFHMSEGGDGLVSYLSRGTGESDAQWRTRIRGVSANACILSDGTVWQMVDWANASGSMNPADRNPYTTGYYNGTVIRDVLGAGFVDPNAFSISCEIAGRRADGPTTAQVRAAIAWGLDMAAMFPTLRGAYGHADQTDTKGCPGTTANMRTIFEGIGGHGLWTQEAPMRPFPITPDPQLVTIKTGAQLYLLDLAPSIKVSTVNGAMSPYTYRTGDVPYRVVEITTGGVKQLLLAKAADCTLTPVVTDCSGPVAAEHERVRAAAIAAVSAL